MRGSSPCLLVGSSVLGLRPGNTPSHFNMIKSICFFFFVSLFRTCLWAQVVSSLVRGDAMSPSRAGTLLTSDSQIGQTAPHCTLVLTEDSCYDF